MPIQPSPFTASRRELNSNPSLRYNPRMKSLSIKVSLLSVALAAACMGQTASPQASQDDAQSLVKQGQKLNAEGKQDEALKLYRQALEKSPNSYQAHLESGMTLDLMGD